MATKPPTRLGFIGIYITMATIVQSKKLGYNGQYYVRLGIINDSESGDVHQFSYGNVSPHVYFLICK